MLIGIFKSNQRIVDTLTILMALLVWGTTFFIDFEIVFSTYRFNIKWLDTFLAVVLIAFQSVYLNWIVNEHKIVANNSHLTSLLLLFFNVCCYQFLNLNQLIIANTFIVIALQQFLKLYNVINSFSLIFNATLLVSVASLIYFPCIIYMVLLWGALIYLRTPVWRDFMISLISFILPYVYYLTYQFVFDNKNIEELGIFIKQEYVYGTNDIFSIVSTFFFIALIIVLLLSVMSLLQTISKSVVKIRKMLMVIVFMLLVGLSTLFFNSFDYLATFVLMSIPLAVITAVFFQNLKKTWLAELIFMCLIVGVIINYFS